MAIICISRELILITNLIKTNSTVNTVPHLLAMLVVVQVLVDLQNNFRHHGMRLIEKSSSAVCRKILQIRNSLSTFNSGAQLLITYALRIGQLDRIEDLVL